MRKANIVLHVGAAHAGSTSLQYALSRLRSNSPLRYAPTLSPQPGVEVADHRWMTESSRFDALCDESLAFVTSHADSSSRRWLIFSDERTSGTLHGPGRLASLMEKLERVANFHLLLSIPNPICAAISAYSTALKAGYEQGFHAPEVSSWPSVDLTLNFPLLMQLPWSTRMVFELDYSRDFLKQYEFALKSITDKAVNLPHAPRMNPSLKLDQASALLRLNQTPDMAFCESCRDSVLRSVTSISTREPLTISESEARQISTPNKFRLGALKSEIGGASLTDEWSFLSGEEYAVHHARLHGRIGSVDLNARLDCRAPTFSWAVSNARQQHDQGHAEPDSDNESDQSVSGGQGSAPAAARQRNRASAQ